MTKTLDFNPIPVEELGNSILHVSLSVDRETPKFILEVYDLYNDSKVTPYSWKASNFNRRFIHSYKVIYHSGAYPRWETAISWITVQLIEKVWKGKVIFDSDAELVYKSILARDELALKAATRIADWRADKAAYPYQNGSKLKLDLADYQKIGKENLREMPCYGLLWEPGVGKTAPTIDEIASTVFETSIQHNRTSQVLILVPKNIRYNWLKELYRFAPKEFLESTNIITISGTEMERNIRAITALAQNKSVVMIANYESYVNTSCLKLVEWDLVVLDESHNIAAPNTKRTKEILSLRDRSKKRIILTGTPIRNQPWDYYTQFEFLGKGLSGFDSYQACKEFFGQFSTIPGQRFKVLEAYQNIPLLRELFAKYTFHLTKKEAIPSLPDKRYSVRSIVMSEDQAQMYSSLADEMIAEIDAMMNNGIEDTLVVNNQLTKMLRLAEITSGYAKLDTSGIYRYDPNPKIEELVEFLKEEVTENDKVLVWAVFQENLKQISARLKLEGIDHVLYYGSTNEKDRREAETRFNSDPNCKVFVGNPDAGGVGLNLVGYNYWDPIEQHLETNATYAIYYSLNWKSVNRIQSEDRNHRRGTRVSPEVIDFLVAGSIDEYIKERVGTKIELNNTLSDVRDILEKIRNIRVNGEA